MSYQRISPNELIQRNPAQCCILDVRTAAEVQAESLPGCLHIPLHELTPEALRQALQARGEQPDQIYLLCQAGRRAEMAANQLQGQVPAQLVVIEGGMNALKAAQIPLQQRGKKIMSLERQVRIAAGALVLMGVLLGALVNPLFYGLSGFVGAGLVFAGITDTCMMGMLIARMPWNK
jgi:rhodanese-related sulfurtransferase